VLRTLLVDQAGMVAHKLAEFTREEIMGMIATAPQQRSTTSPTTDG
jgi:hypothetical protein